MRHIDTKWQLRTYAVWGNAKDGYEVNNVFSAGVADIRLTVTVNNVGTPFQFESAYPTDAQIRSALGWSRIRINTEGDDTTIYVNRDRDGYPIGEMHCTSHESLSPIRAIDAGCKHSRQSINNGQVTCDECHERMIDVTA
jgi:hypothetical protein